jgi:spore coat polysaccharide biosynthesis protein SpsF
MTPRVVRVLDALPHPFAGVAVVGRAFSHEEALAQVLAGAAHSWSLRRDVSDMASLMAGADLAVASFGVTAYELAAVGVPSVHLALTPEHAASSGAFGEAGIGLPLGVYGEVDNLQIAASVAGLLDDPDQAAAMGERASQLVDGLGANRIAERIAAMILARAQ